MKSQHSLVGKIISRTRKFSYLNFFDFTFNMSSFNSSDLTLSKLDLLISHWKRISSLFSLKKSVNLFPKDLINQILKYLKYIIELTYNIFV